MAALMVANMVLPLIFISTLEGQVVLATFLLAAGIQMALFRAKGFDRLLGLGHLPWLPLVLWSGVRLREIGTESALGKWLLVLIVLDSITLLIDAVDVGRYLNGERRPSSVLQA